MRFLATVEDWPQAVRGTGPAGREQGRAGANRRHPRRSVACEPEPGSAPSLVQCLSHLVWTSVIDRRPKCITNQAAVYGFVRTVVWEGRRSEPSPNPI